MISPGLIKSFVAEGAVAARRIVKFGSADTTVLTQTTAAPTAAGTVGISDAAGDCAIGDRVDVVMDGICEIVLGGTVTRGDPLTSDATGAGVTAAPAAGVNVWTVGLALASGVSGDIIPVQVDVERIQG